MNPNLEQLNLHGAKENKIFIIIEQERVKTQIKEISSFVKVS